MKTATHDITLLVSGWGIARCRQVCRAICCVVVAFMVISLISASMFNNNNNSTAVFQWRQDLARRFAIRTQQDLQELSFYSDDIEQPDNINAHLYDRMMTIKAAAAANPNDTLYLYNRIPKCGSRGIQDVLRHFSQKHHRFLHAPSKVYCYSNISYETQRQYVEKLNAFPTPTVFDRHIYFVDFTRFGAPQPVYLNVVRDPIDRYISSYFWKREDMVGKCTNIELGENYMDSRRHLTIPQCLNRKDMICMGPSAIYDQIKYFCGMDDHCTLGRTGLGQAIDNLDRAYAVVGLYENMEDFFELLEWMFPDHFGGSKLYYTERRAKMVARFRTKGREEVRNNTRNRLRFLLSYEYELYEFARQRFDAQMAIMRQHKQQQAAVPSTD